MEPAAARIHPSFPAPAFYIPARPLSAESGAGCGRPFSPLVLADRLITLAQDADRAGFRDAAANLVTLVYSVLDEARG